MRATGERAFARTYGIAQQLELAATTTVLSTASDSSRPGKPVTFTATVVGMRSRSRVTSGAVQFYVNGDRSGAPVSLENGQASWKAPLFRPGEHRVAAAIVGRGNGTLVPSRSVDLRHTVAGGPVR